MRAVAHLADPDKVEATITLTMSLKEWKEVMADLTSSENGPWQVRDTIRDLIAQMQERFYVRESDKLTKG